MRRKRILVDTFHLHHAATGIRTYTLEYCNGIDQYKDTLMNDYFFVPQLEKIASSKLFHGRMNIFKKLLHHVSYFLWKQLILPLHAIRLRADYVVITDFVAPVWKPGFHVFTVFHDVFFWELKEHYQPIWRKYYTIMAELGVRKKAAIVATSNYTKRKIERWVNTSAPIQVIYQTYKQKDESGFSDDDFLQQFHIQSGQYFLHVGYFDKRKNIPLLINAFAVFLKKTDRNDIKLVLVGGRAASQYLDDYALIVEQIEANGLSQKVVMTGFLTDGQLQSAYRNARALVFPSYDEGFGIPVLEAFSNEIPVIVSNRGATAEIGGEAVLIAQWDDPNDFAVKMNDILDITTQDNLIQSGKERLKMFSLASFVKSWDKIILDEK